MPITGIAGCSVRAPGGRTERDSARVALNCLITLSFGFVAGDAFGG
jgi:hypothetical protein